MSPEEWDEKTERFIEPKCKVLQLEHSLMSLSKWESKWCKPFLSKTDMTPEETIDYIKCMTITPNVDPEVYDHLTEKNIDEVVQYINAPMTATTFAEDKSSKNNREIITAELIYYWMIALQIPSEYQKWHLNKLLTLIRVCNIKNQPPKKRSKRDIMSRNAALNAARRKQLNSKG
jgi:hypothetical protein